MSGSPISEEAQVSEVTPATPELPKTPTQVYFHVPRRQEPPLPLEDTRAARLRDAQAIQRIMVSPIQTTDKLETTLLSLAENLSSLRDELHKQGHPHWWHLADAVDDVMDVYELHFGLVPPAEPVSSAS